jgi:hypothetical protein
MNQLKNQAPSDPDSDDEKNILNDGEVENYEFEQENDEDPLDFN